MLVDREEERKNSIRQIQTELCCVWTCQTFRLLKLARSLIRSLACLLVRCAKFYNLIWIYFTFRSFNSSHTARGRHKRNTPQTYFVHTLIFILRCHITDSDVAQNLISKIENCKIFNVFLFILIGWEFFFSSKSKIKFQFVKPKRRKKDITINVWIQDIERAKKKKTPTNK